MSEHDHIMLPEAVVTTLSYSSARGRGSELNLRPRDREQHAARLLEQFNHAWQVENQLKNSRNALALPTRSGTYLEFKSAPNCDLLIKSLEATRSGIRLLNVRQQQIGEELESLATVFIPEGKAHIFLNKINAYANSDNDSINETTGEVSPKHNKLISSIEDINLALLVNSFWTDKKAYSTEHPSDWYEIWLKIEKQEDLDREIGHFLSLLDQLGITYKHSYLYFPERAVVLINGNNSHLINIINSSDLLAEIKYGQEPAGFWYHNSPSEQHDWVEDLLNRLIVDEESSVTVCVLDTGVNNGHQLLSPMLSDQHCLTVNPNWGTADFRKHGTQMAGIVSYGDLASCLETRSSIHISHKLCSVKILPDNDGNDKELWGDITKQSIYRAEIELAGQNVIYCMAITAPDDESICTPSSWSATIDSLAYNDNNTSRLIILSGGNIPLDDTATFNNYPIGNRIRSIQNPAQSWNALTIGAYTEKSIIKDKTYPAYTPLAPIGGLSPYSTTSMTWPRRNRPIKPEVVFEGGNVAVSRGVYDSHADLGVLTTHSHIQQQQFDTICATSAASAFAANLAAKIAVKYPNLWAESIRGLIVHSAEWTDVMKEQFPGARREDMRDRLSCCGFGVPSERRALSDTDNGFTYIAQSILKPFHRSGNTIKFGDMHFYELPWPKEVLEQLGDVSVSLRITLSYFIEPSPGERGWEDKYRYASHGLRFDLNSPLDTPLQFQQRINHMMQDETGGDYGDVDNDRWTIGPRIRQGAGSVYTDMIETTAAELSACNCIAVFPINGWWKQRKNMGRYNNRVRYSLIVSLNTPAEDVELYNIVATKIANILQSPVEIPIPIEDDMGQ